MTTIGESVTIEEAVNRIVDKINLKLVIAFVAMVCTVINTGAVSSATIFTGYIPYNDWECTSDKCFHLQSEAGSTGKFFSYDTMCGNELVAGSDFEWTSKMRTFSMDWHLYCGKEAIFSLINGGIGFGSLIGLISTTGLYDKIGRKKVGVLGSILSILSVAASSAAPNYQVLLFLRIISGFGIFVNFNGTFCWIVEYAPAYLRIPMAGFVSLGWVAGLYVSIGLSYLLGDWHNIFLAIAGVNILSLLTYFLIPLPESPRFSLIRGREEEAKKTLQKLARISDSNVNVECLDLMFEERNEFNYLEQIKDFKTYPNMLKQTLLGLWVWFAVSLISYSYSYGWSKIGDDLFSTYSFSALGEGVAFSSSVFVCRLLGHKRTTIFYLAMVILMNLLAMVDVQISTAWSLELVVGLIGYVATTSAFNMIYLVSAELAPTSHRGMILCLSSSAARIGSFIGPYASLLHGVTDRRVPLALFAGCALLTCIAMWFIPDTTNRSIPETPADVELLSRRRRKEEEDGDEGGEEGGRSEVTEGRRRKELGETERETNVGEVVENRLADPDVIMN